MYHRKTFPITTSYLIGYEGSKIVCRSGTTGLELKSSTDFSTVLQWAIDDIPTGATGGGAKIKIKSGLYSCDADIVETSTSKTAIWIEGEVPSFQTEGTVLKKDTAGTYVLRLKSNYNFVSDLYINGNSNASYGIRTGDIDAGYYRVSVGYCNTAGLYISSNNCWVRDCWIEYNDGAGIYSYVTRAQWYLGNLFYRNSDADIHFKSAATYDEPQYCMVSACRFAETDNGIWLDGNSGEMFGLNIFGNIAYRIGDQAGGGAFHDNFIYVDTQCNNLTIANNILNGESITVDFIDFQAHTINDVRLSNNNIFNTTNYVTGGGNCTRLIINNSSTNVGNPAAAGDWNGITPQEGTIIKDTTPGNTYLYINGGYVTI